MGFHPGIRFLRVVVKVCRSAQVSLAVQVLRIAAWFGAVSRRSAQRAPALCATVLRALRSVPPEIARSSVRVGGGVRPFFVPINYIVCQGPAALNKYERE